jgi:phage-related protein
MIKDGADLQEVMGVLNTNFGGAGEAAANTAAGGMKKLGIAFGETKESIGAAFLPVFEKLLPVLNKFSDWAQKNPTLLASVVIGIGAVSAAIVIFNAVQALTIALNTALTASFSALYVATGVIVIIAIIAAIVALQAKFNILGKGVELLKGVFNSLWGTVKTVFNWVASNWPLLLAIITGPFGLAVYGIIKFKDSIIGVLQGIKDFAKTIFDGIIGAYKTVMNAVLGLMESGINKAISGLNTALDAVDAAAGPLVNFGTIPDISIPRLADGGIVTGPTLALIGEAGPEAVIPLNRAGSMGNTFNVYVQGADPQAVVRALQDYNRTAGPIPVNTRAN